MLQSARHARAVALAEEGLVLRVTRKRLLLASALLLGAWAAVAGAASAGPLGLAAPRPDVAIWVYDAHRWSGTERDAHLGSIAGTARRLYLSVEDGPRFLLDDPAGARRLGDVLDRAVEGFGLEVEAMLLQDPSWVRDPAGAVGRVARVVAFHAARRAEGRPGLAGLHFDIEPHTEDTWPCASSAQRTVAVRALRDIFRRAGAVARAGAPGPPLRLSAALPWWLGPLSVDVPGAAPAAWLAALDEVVLMVYGDPGGPLVGESPEAVLRRVEDARLWRDLPAGGGLRLGLATFEYRDAGALRAALDTVARQLAGRPAFRGFALFAQGLPFAAPLVTLLEGRVVDREGRPVAGARVRAGDRVALTGPCGVFALRELPPDGVELDVRAEGFAPARVRVPSLVPGRLRELPPLRLETP